MALHYKQNRTYLKNKRRHYSEVTENKEVLLKIVRVRLYCSLVICWVKWLWWSCVNIKREREYPAYDSKSIPGQTKNLANQMNI